MKTSHVTRKIASSLSMAAGLLLLGVILLTVADVVSRNVLGASILGTVEISTLLLVTIAFLGLASAEIDGRHVAVNLIEEKLPFGSRKVLCAVRIILLLGLFVIVAWGLFNVLLSSIDRQETTNGILRLPTWPAKLVVFGSFSFYFVVALLSSIEELKSKQREQ
ncbi:TRAP transporter small permease [Halomonas sp. HMF6819]|uniref:TRAP transporter small permease n=1 Tax=Halomonas sp. HMF6819 TaxID=3373085 RepID=UPI0037B940B1